ncbi:MAG: hypothetical protein RLZZ69_3344 [Cyanobacteriota bacterium]
MANFEVEKQEWWVERWLELLNSYRFKKRLERGRNYAREGNVLSIDFSESKFAHSYQNRTSPSSAKNSDDFSEKNLFRINK